MIDPTIIALPTLAAGTAGAVVAYRKTSPNIESISVKTMESVIEALREEVGRLSAEVRTLRAENVELRRTVSELKRHQNGS